MTKTTRYIAVTSTAAIEAGSMAIIWGLGTTPELALEDAAINSGSAEGDYDTLPASERLADYVEKHGADADLDWTDKHDDGVADLIDGEEVEVAAIVAGSFEDLLVQLTKSGVGYDEEEAAVVLYVQLDSKSGWAAAFAPRENHHEMDMTRWSSGKDVLELFAAIDAKNISDIEYYASDIISGWDSNWTI